VDRADSEADLALSAMNGLRARPKSAIPFRQSSRSSLMKRRLARAAEKDSERGPAF